MTRRAGDLWTDATMLRALDLHERQGLTASAVAERLSGETRMRVSRSAILGLMKRIKDELARVPDTATRPENRDGGMQAEWWRAGLRKREAGKCS